MSWSVKSWMRLVSAICKRYVCAHAQLKPHAMRSFWIAQAHVSLLCYVEKAARQTPYVSNCLCFTCAACRWLPLHKRVWGLPLHLNL